MPNVVQKPTALREDAGTNIKLPGWVRALSPLAVPFLILLCEPRWEMLVTAICWSLLVLPGALAVHVFFPHTHPFGRGIGRFAVASVGGLFLFGLISWPACLLHRTLTTALILYAVFYLVCIAALLWVLIRRGPVGEKTDEPWTNLEVSLGGPRYVAAIVILGITIFMAGVALATVETQEPYMTPGLYGARAYWWQGTVLGAVASVLVAPVILLGIRQRRNASHDSKQPSKKKRSGRKADRRHHAVSPSNAFHSGAWLVIFLWLGVLGLTWHTMKVAYALPAKDIPRHAYRPPWNSDDVSYVSQAVDYRYGLQMGKCEASIGSDRRMSRTGLSPLIEPLVAMIARVTGVGCAALHHSVMRPLVILMGVSAMAALLRVVFRMHRWAVPLGLLVVLMVVAKSWEYERSMVEFTVWRPMQTKSIHLWLIYPLQLASLLLLAFRPNKRHLLLGLAVAVVGHLVHPFSTILGAVWSAVLCAAVAVTKHNVLPKAILLLACYAALGAEFRVTSRAVQAKGPLSHGRIVGEPEQSRDLVRIDDKPIRRHDPRILFGWNMVFNLGALAVPIVLAMGWRHREFLLPGLIGAITIICCNTTFLGNLINKALPTSILWRFRWVLPALLHAAIVSFVLYWAFSVLLRRRDHTMTPTRSFLASLAVVAIFVGMLFNTSGYAMSAGPSSKQLSKFSDDIHGLVELLGGLEASPFVWGPRTVTRELPQLMPNVRLVLSRRKLMLPADSPEFRNAVLRTRSIFYAPAGRFRGGRAPQDAHLRAALRQLTDLYPIDHIVLDYSAGRGAQGARVLRKAGGERIGRSGVYEVWRIPPQP